MHIAPRPAWCVWGGEPVCFRGMVGAFLQSEANVNVHVVIDPALFLHEVFQFAIADVAGTAFVVVGDGVTLDVVVHLVAERAGILQVENRIGTSDFEPSEAEANGRSKEKTAVHPFLRHLFGCAHLQVGKERQLLR